VPRKNSRDRQEDLPFNLAADSSNPYGIRGNKFEPFKGEEIDEVLKMATPFRFTDFEKQIGI